MSITDELREWAKMLTHWWYDPVKDEYTYTTGTMPPSIDAVRLDSNIIAIADRIDAEHKKAVASVMNDALYHANEKDMAEHGWIRLPVDGEAPRKQLCEWIEKCGLITGPLDHDGELWHKGDMSASPWGVIEGIVCENGKWFIRGHDTSAPWLPADSLLHYRAPTVEDVLREFADAILEWAGKSGTVAEVGTWSDVAAEYAAKLRLAEGEDA